VSRIAFSSLTPTETESDGVSGKVSWGGRGKDERKTDGQGLDNKRSPRASPPQEKNTSMRDNRSQTEVKGTHAKPSPAPRGTSIDPHGNNAQSAKEQQGLRGGRERRRRRKRRNRPARKRV